MFVVVVVVESFRGGKCTLAVSSAPANRACDCRCPWSVIIGDERGALLPLCASYGVLKCNQECELCSDPVLLSDFYLFPCLHAFHSKCLFNEVR